MLKLLSILFIGFFVLASCQGQTGQSSSSSSSSSSSTSSSSSSSTSSSTSSSGGSTSTGDFVNEDEVGDTETEFEGDVNVVK